MITGEIGAMCSLSVRLGLNVVPNTNPHIFQLSSGSFVQLEVFHPCWVSLLGCNGYSFICLWSIAPFASLHLCLGSVEAATSNVVNE